MLRAIKVFLRRHAPFVVSLWRWAKYSPIGGKTAERAFGATYRAKKRGVHESRSGSGSNLMQTRVIRNALPILIQELGCRSLLDLPCGDFYWMRTVNLDVDYTGGDIVDEIIERNAELYGGAKRKFIRVDLIRDDLPKADLVICRDCLVHFPYSAVFAALRNIKRSGSAYLLTTTFPEKGANEDIPTGAWRPLNLELPPFRLPPPLKVINEGHTDAEFRDKSLSLWRIVDIPDFA